MKLIIQGDDQRKAKTWIQFAKNKLRQIKTFTPVPVLINEIFRPVTDILIHIKSVNNLDTIRIVTEGGKYRCNFPTVDRYPIPHSDFLLQCPVQPSSVLDHLRIVFFSMTNDISIGGDWENYDWDFGDGNVGSGVFVFNEYAEPGEYTVTLTVSNGLSTVNAPSNDTGGDYQYGEDISFPGANENTAYANYVGSAPVTANNAYKWIASGSHDWQTKERYFFESQEASMEFDLTAVDPLATVTCYMQVLLSDWINHYPNYGDPGQAAMGVASTVVSSLGGSATPVIGGQFAPWETFNMGDLTPFIGTVKQVTFQDSGGHAQLPTFRPGLPPFDLTRSNQTGIRGTDSWAEVQTPTSLQKTTKVIKLYSGRRGRKRTFQVGDSVHT